MFHPGGRSWSSWRVAIFLRARGNGEDETSLISGECHRRIDLIIGS
jgi:hypothetical protein